MHGFVSSARRDPGRRRPAGARPARRADQPPPACAREPARQPGRLGADRRPRAARRGRRIAARHDPRRRSEPADLGRHLPRERRPAPPVPGRAPPAIEQLESALDSGDAGFLARWIGEAAGNRRRMLADAYADPGELQQLRVHVPDRPGVLAGITQALGAERINIEDFELHHVSPDRGGTLTLLVGGEDEAAAPPRCSSPRATASSSRRCCPSEDRARHALVGHIAVPGDKSISHRAVLVGAVAEGETLVRGFGRSADTESTIAAVRALGVTVHEDDVDTLRVEGAGLRGLREPDAPIDCGNSGTTLRLLAGLLAGQSGRFELTGDDSLRGRPVDRIATPLGRDGRPVEPRTAARRSSSRAGRCRRSATSCRSRARRSSRASCTPGCTRRGGRPWSSRCRRATTPSSCSRRQGRRSRAGRAACRSGRPSGSSSPRSRCPATSRRPRRSSSRRRCCPGSELTIHDVGLNPRRTGLLDVLARMGARITAFNRRRSSGGEPMGDLEVRSAELVATKRRRRGGAAPDRRAAALRARGRLRARREPGRRRAGAARKGNGPSRDRDNFATSPGRAHRKPSRWLRGERGTFPPEGWGNGLRRGSSDCDAWGGRGACFPRRASSSRTRRRSL